MCIRLKSALAVILLTIVGVGCGPLDGYAPPTPPIKNYVRVNWASFSPLGQEIVFSTSHKKYGGIFLMNFQGKVTKWLFKNSGGVRYNQPFYSYDGERLTFIADLQNKMSGIYISNTDGRNPKKVTGTTDSDLYPMFSPDGNRIYFVRSEYYMGNSFSGPRWRSKSDLYYADLTKGTTNRVTHEEFIDMRRPQPFPNGKEILLYLRFYPMKNCIWIINLANPSIRVPIQPNKEKYWKEYPSYEFTNLEYPALSRDGRYLAIGWTGYTERSYAQVYLCDMRTMQAKPITFYPGVKHPMDISSDSSKVIFRDDTTFVKGKGGWPSNLYMVNLDGTGLINFTLDFADVAGQAPAVEGKAGGKP